MIIGLTGGSGTGKSSAAKYIENRGFLTVDFDRVSRDVSRKGSECLEEIVNVFGNDILNDDGTLNRRALGEIVFADSEKLVILTSITHKYILIETETIIKANHGKNLLFDAPLLFEAELEKKCDFVICVIADRDIRIKRICQRDSITEEVARNRIDSQKSDDYYIEKSDFCVRNDSDIRNLERQLEEILRRIFNESDTN